MKAKCSADRTSAPKFFIPRFFIVVSLIFSYRTVCRGAKRWELSLLFLVAPVGRAHLAFNEEKKLNKYFFDELKKLFRNCTHDFQ